MSNPHSSLKGGLAGTEVLSGLGVQSPCVGLSLCMEVLSGLGVQSPHAGSGSELRPVGKDEGILG